MIFSVNGVRVDTDTAKLAAAFTARHAIHDQDGFSLQGDYLSAYFLTPQVGWLLVVLPENDAAIARPIDANTVRETLNRYGQHRALMHFFGDDTGRDIC